MMEKPMTASLMKLSLAGALFFWGRCAERRGNRVRVPVLRVVLLHSVLCR